MKNIKNVFLFEFKTKLKEKTIIISTIIMLVIVLGGTFIPRFINNDEKVPTIEEQIEEMGKVGFVIQDKNIKQKELKEIMPFKMAKEYLKREDLVDAIKSEEIKKGIIIENSTNFILVKAGSEFSMYDPYQELEITEGLLTYNRNEFFKTNDIDLKVMEEADNIEISSSVEEIGKSAEKNYFVAYFGVFIIYFLVLIYGSSVATSVAREKNDRTMEILITNTSAVSLIIGKVFASLVISGGQLIFMILSGVVGIFINKNSYPPALLEMVTNSISPSVVMVFLAFTIVGCILYYFAYATLGSLVSRVEDVNNAVSPIQSLFVGAFIIATLSMSNPTGNMMVATSFIPFTSPMSMFVRYSMIDVPLSEVLISFLILIVTTVLLSYLCIKIYRKSTLNYGNKLSLAKVIREFKKEV